MQVATAGVGSTVQSGPLIFAAGISVFVGLLGFLSPCVLPLVPGYLSYVAGLSGVDPASNRSRTVAGAALFVAGFTAVFVCAGVFFGALGSLLRDDRLTIERILGVVTVAFGLAFMGLVPAIQREIRVPWRPASGLMGAPALGFTFGLAWSPCLPPTFGVVYSMAYTEGTAARGAFLLTCYCLGLGVPFVLVALGLDWVTGALDLARRHRRVLSRLGGAALVVMGVLLATGAWDHWMDWLHDQFGQWTGLGSSF